MTTRIDAAPGLTAAEVASRRRDSGYNEIAEAREHPMRALLGRFWGLSAWMLETIMVLSAILRKYPDLIVVTTLLVVNAVVGFMQERRAAGVVAVLRRRLQVSARVRRDAAWQVIPARELVPGDVVRVRAGDIIPADIAIVSGAISVDESALTGESVNAEKAVGDQIASASIARRGEATGTVVRTGARTTFGRTTELVQQARPALHIDAVMSRIVRWLFLVVSALLGVVVVLSMARGTSLIEIVPLVLILLMSAIPLSLPVMFTVSMAVGSKALAARGVLVTRLSAAEDAATMDVLCVDKTGTITLNQLAVTGVIPEAGRTEGDVLRAGALASQDANQDPIDLAFLAAARAQRVFDGATAVAPISFAPFDARNRRTEAIFEQDGRRWRAMKGAVDTIAQACALAPAAIDALVARAGESAVKGYRSLAVALGPEAGAPAFLGVVTLIDPLRPDAGELIATLHDLGVSVKMLTGDALPVARDIGRGVGLPNIQRVSDLSSGVDGLAEVFPEDKFAVVKHLQAEGHVTGMTGDGVNDAPALRQAEVGIAVSTATDVAKGAASVVLTDAGLTNIVALVEEGRTIYQRILTYIINKVSRTILKTSFVAIAFVVTGKFVVSAFAMLLLVFITDAGKISLATDHVRPSRQPETWNIAPLVGVAVALGVLMVGEALFGLWWATTHWVSAAGDATLGTLSFLLLLDFAAFSIVSGRERRWFWSTAPSRPVALAVVAEIIVGTSVTLIGAPGLPPLPAWQAFSVFGFALFSCLVVNDAAKVALIAFTRRRAKQIR